MTTQVPHQFPSTQTALSSSSSSSSSSSPSKTSPRTPSSTPSTISHHSDMATLRTSADNDQKAMAETGTTDNAAAAASGEEKEQKTETADPTPTEAEPDATTGATKSPKKKCRKPKEHKRKSAAKSKKGVKARRGHESSSDSDDSSSDSSVDSSDSSDSDSDSDSESDVKRKSKSKSHKHSSKKSRKSSTRKAARRSKHVSDSDESGTASSCESDDEVDDVPPGRGRRSKNRLSTWPPPARRNRKIGKSLRFDPYGTTSSYDHDRGLESEDHALRVAELEQELADAKLKAKQKSKKKRSGRSSSSKRRPEKEALQFKRVDELWDNTLHNWKLRESTDADDSEFAEFAFLVRRTFDWDNKFRETFVDIKSKPLRDALAIIMKGCKFVSLESEHPSIEPNHLFLYLETMREYYKKTLKAKIKAEKKRKIVRKLEHQRRLIKMLVAYLDEDYQETRKKLEPLLKAGNITYDLLWALYHPDDTLLTSCYGVWDEPRCFKLEYAHKCCSMTRGDWYSIEGKYLEFDGKDFGFGDINVDVDGFKGPRKITSLATYPLKYHKEPEKVKAQILERAQKFVSLEGVHYKFHKGLAFFKKRHDIRKININGRIMVDPAIFRRINPNYSVAAMKPKDEELIDLFGVDKKSSDDECSCGEEDENALNDAQALEQAEYDHKTPKYKYKWAKDDKGHPTLMPVEVDSDGEPIHKPKAKLDLMALHPDLRNKTFSEEDLLLTSPVVLGFAFSEKLWLEFTVSGVVEVEYNEGAFDSLVLPPNQKSIVRALVESHKHHAASTIDDVVQGKGKGLVAVLHGPPGTGKTLTAEGISELLKVPLYMVSAGELGTESGRLEAELTKILDIAHSWGAVLLLDEADVFLEKREVHDIHRNALVSIFLRLLEYFQGILFLTTNRVETFDDAFQSRIHVALRYGELSPKAKKTVFKMFLDMVRKVEGMEVGEFPEAELDALSRHSLNGRQIKNVVRTAQALALNEKQMLTLDHIKRVLDVAETFDRDLKGGTGYIDAMRSYT